MTMYTCVCTAITRNAVSIMLIMIILVHHSILVWSMDCSYQEDSNISILGISDILFIYYAMYMSSYHGYVTKQLYCIKKSGYDKMFHIIMIYITMFTPKNKSYVWPWINTLVHYWIIYVKKQCL